MMNAIAPFILFISMYFSLDNKMILNQKTRHHIFLTNYFIHEINNSSRRKVFEIIQHESKIKKEIDVQETEVS